MHLNPFLRAFFRSTFPAQCTPVHNHILLVPTTETLLTCRERGSGVPYSELASSEEFLGSHVIRLPGAPVPGVEEAGLSRDGRGKAKHFTTINGRTVVIKNAVVYSNKGFQTLVASQLLHDIIWYPDTLDAQQWVLYFISKPLIGSLELISIIPATPSMSPRPPRPGVTSTTPAIASKKDVKTFNDLLNNFPVIARQLQSGLERIFTDFARRIQIPLPRTSPKPESDQERPLLDPESPLQSSTNGDIRSPEHARLAPLALLNQDSMRSALEDAIAAAIDLFQTLDKQLLSFLGASTELTGPIVERLIERYIIEQVHDAVIFPALCACTRSEDQELEYRIKQMDSVDVSQVGIEIKGGIKGKRDLTLRLGRAVEVFRRLGTAGSPHEMIQILLDTERIVTMDGPEMMDATTRQVMSRVERSAAALTMNADTLVSLLLIVVIRSQVRHLQARLTYMRRFIFLDDTEGGEIGYALSTFEAVLAYLAKDSGGLRKASRRNKALWQAVRHGDMQKMSAILKPDLILHGEGSPTSPEKEATDSSDDEHAPSTHFDVSHGRSDSPSPRQDYDVHRVAQSAVPGTPSLSQTFPSHPRTETGMRQESMSASKSRKRVSMDTGSMSSSSVLSIGSFATTVDSFGSGIGGDTSIERLARTQDGAGNSLLMMAIESRQPDALRFLLTLEEYFTFEVVLQDVNNQGTTLLSAAMQLGDHTSIETLLNQLRLDGQDEAVVAYLKRKDNDGRTAAHYLFNASPCIRRLGRLVPWRLKDKNGQTPLFALCRSYDHPGYREMIQEALTEAQVDQDDNQPLHLDDHVDGKGNTLLHVVNDPRLAAQLMAQCDINVNATNDKNFTALMVASKYGRIDMVRTFFGDPRVDVGARDLRGLTAVELAKDDDIRNRIDDLMLLSDQSALDGRTTAVVRSFFVEDATIRLVLKSAAPSSKSTITITTCRRSLLDFENLAKWLAIEHPASWLPPLSSERSPFQLPSKPSRAVLRDIQQRLDSFLKVLLTHSTFANHELLWEFFLAPEIQPEMMAERSQKKAEIRLEMVKEEYTPIGDVREVENFVGHARDTIRSVSHATKSVIRRVNAVQNQSQDLFEAHHLLHLTLSTFSFLPTRHLSAVLDMTETLGSPSNPPLAAFHYALQSLFSTILGLSISLSYPGHLIHRFNTTQSSVAKNASSLNRSHRWPLGLLDDTRGKVHAETREIVAREREEIAMLGRELRYTKEVVAGELAGWQDTHAKAGRKALKIFAVAMIVRERDRLDSMNRAIRRMRGVRGSPVEDSVRDEEL